MPILGILLCGYLIAQMPWSTFIQLKWFFLLGAVIYLGYGMNNSQLHKAKLMVPDEVPPINPKKK